MGGDELDSIVLPTETLQWLHGETSTAVQTCSHGDREQKFVSVD